LDFLIFDWWTAASTASSIAALFGVAGSSAFNG
jgi:hypothetical protein